jgi:flagellum-specific ATP synthase
VPERARTALLSETGRVREAIAHAPTYRTVGRVRSSRGLILSCRLQAAVGDHCEIVTGDGRGLRGEVIGFSDDSASLVLYETAEEVFPGMTVVNRGHALRIPVGSGLLGRVLDGLGRPMDSQGPLRNCTRRAMRLDSPSPLRRARVRRAFVTGQRAIDGFLTCGRGQRLGIFAGSGVGKSTLLGEIAKGSDADVNVIALIGERGREVQPFIEDCLGPQGMAKSVVVVATADQTPLMRVRAAELALAFADHFRGLGRNVLLMVDSMTRLAMAQRELGLALGEPSSARSYTPSVFQLLANYVERMGNSEHGSITGLLTVLVEGDDLDEPITDAVRSFVDGHIVLDRRLAEMNHYPAIDIGRSISRVAHEIIDPGHREAAGRLRALLATYAEAEDLIRIGAYVKGSVPALDRAIDLRPAVLDFLRQRVDSRSRLDETQDRMRQLAAAWPF